MYSYLSYNNFTIDCFLKFEKFFINYFKILRTNILLKSKKKKNDLRDAIKKKAFESTLNLKQVDYYYPKEVNNKIKTKN